MGNNLSRRRQERRQVADNQRQPTAAAQRAQGYVQGRRHYPAPLRYGASSYGDGGQQQQQQQQQQQRQPNVPQQQQHPQQQPHAQTELQQTKTIRNQVNLKKETLRVVPYEEDESLLTPTFNFDASAPCSVTIFLMAKEDGERTSRLTTHTQKPGPRVAYQKGLGLAFPPAGDRAVAKSHSLQLDLYEQSTLTNMSLKKGDYFPVIIRLETITDKGVKEGHKLEELDPGCSTPWWVQSQTTYSCLVREEDGTWEARPLRQKIWVDNVSYELQEIYGIQDIYGGEKKEKGVSLPAKYSEELEGRECVICLAAVRDTTVLPCRHMCMCGACARELQRQQVSRCPICRDLIESLLHIKRPEKKGAENKEDGLDGKTGEAASTQESTAFLNENAKRS